MQEDATSQERIHLDPISGRTVGTPQSYIRRGQWTHLNPGQERTVNTPQSCWSGEDTYISGEATPRSCRVSAWERNISIPNNNGPSGIQDSKPPEGEGKDGDDFEV
jgi:hypothetical protein